MKTLLSILVVLIVAATAVGETYVTSDITTSETWTPAGSPYIIQANIVVPAWATLTIQSSPTEGVTVAFDGYYYLNTETGSIIAEGSANHPVVFTSNAGLQAPGDWTWVQTAGAVPSSFSYCTFEYAQMGIRANGNSPTISHCTVRSCSQVGIFCIDASPTIEYCDIYDNPDGIHVFYSSAPTLPVVNNNNIYGNTSYNLRVIIYPVPGGTINAENNWWGTDVEGEIQQEIRDSTDSPDIHATVDYDPWLMEQPVDVSTWSRIKNMFNQ